MEKATKEQIRRGLRIGIGLGCFLIGVMLMGNGLRRVLVSDQHRIIWGDAIGWTELVSAGAILFVTAREWLMLLAGCLLFGAIKGLVTFVAGRFPSREFSTRLEPFAVAVYCLASLLLMVRFSEQEPTVLDKLTLTLFLFSFWPAVVGVAFSMWQIAGLLGLLTSWCVSRWRTGGWSGLFRFQ